MLSTSMLIKCLMVNILCSTPFNPLSPNINMYILLSVVHTFLKVQVERICANIKIFYVWWSFLYSCDLLAGYAPLNLKVQHLPPGNPPGIWTFEDWLVQIPSPRGKKAVQMPHQLVLNYLSSKTNFVFNQTLYTPFWEIHAVMTPSNFFYRPFW